MDEKLRVLKMVEEGKLTAGQAIGLLDAMEETESKDAAGNKSAWEGKAEGGNIAMDASYENKMLRVVVDCPEGDKVNVQLPVKIIRQILKVTGKLPVQGAGMRNLDLEALTASVLECLDNEALGNIVDVNTSDGTTVKVFIG